MRMEVLSDEDEALITAAGDVLSEHFEPGRHRCSAALRTASGAVYTGINVLSAADLASVHAEQVALGRVVLAGESTIETSVAVVFADDDGTNPVQVVSACGTCRELLCEFSPDARVIVPADGSWRKVPVVDLLPAKA